MRGGSLVGQNLTDREQPGSPRARVKFVSNWRHSRIFARFSTCAGEVRQTSFRNFGSYKVFHVRGGKLKY